ncbi:Cytosolic Fe-S cluster assembly factor CFD1 [Verticillium dahliae VDG2]|nr:Cytosolic Fe-S cluster assembly factor CFD1 [Verticillium dahliae VDG2]
MRPTSILTLAALLELASARAQEVPAPPVPQILPAPLTTSTTTITVIEGTPQPPGNSPPPPPPPPPAPPSSAPTGSPPTNGATCVCGATYCGKVLRGSQGYTQDQVSKGYCSSPGIDCASAQPDSNRLDDSLFPAGEPVPVPAVPAPLPDTAPPSAPPAPAASAPAAPAAPAPPDAGAAGSSPPPVRNNFRHFMW